MPSRRIFHQKFFSNRINLLNLKEKKIIFFEMPEEQ